MKNRFLLFIFTLILAETSMATECIVLLHGFGRSSFSLGRINSNLLENGYKTIPIDYPSRKYNAYQLVDNFILPQIKNEAQNCTKIHFVGYSLGGILIRHILANHRPENLGRVVYIGSPHQGVDIVEQFGHHSWFSAIFGPAVADLGLSSSFLRSLPQKADYEAGVISGNFSANPFTSLFLIPGEDDGTVSVESTKIMGMKDHIVVPSTHTLLLYNDRVIEEVENFISHGYFRK